MNMPITASNPFKWRHYPGDVILWCVRWYLRYPILVKAKREGHIQRVKPLLDTLVNQANFWVGAQLYRRVLDEVGE